MLYVCISHNIHNSNEFRQTCTRRQRQRDAKYLEQSYMEMAEAYILRVHSTNYYSRINFKCFPLPLLLPPKSSSRRLEIFSSPLSASVLSLCVLCLHLAFVYPPVSLSLFLSGKNWMVSWIGIFVIRLQYRWQYVVCIFIASFATHWFLSHHCVLWHTHTHTQT